MTDAILRWQSTTDGTTFGSLPTSGSGILALMFRANNSDATDNGNPLVIPDAGTIQSFEKKCQVSIETNLSTNQISNLKFYVSSQNMGTGITQYYGFTSPTTAPTSANRSVATTEVPTSANMTTWGGVTPTTGTGKIGNYIVMQVDVGSTASRGLQTEITYTCRYDEI